MLARRVDDGLAITFPGHVGNNRSALSAGGVHFGSYGFNLLARARGEEHSGALLRKSNGNRAANAPARAGHNSYFAFQKHSCSNSREITAIKSIITSPMFIAQR